MISIRQSLLRNQIVIIVLLGGAIMATTFLGAQAAVRSLSRSIIGQAVNQTELELRRFFEPARLGLEAAEAWGEGGLLSADSDDDIRRLNRLFAPIVVQSPQISSVIVADDSGFEYMLLRAPGRWQTRITRPEWGARTFWLDWTDESPEPVESWQEIDYDPRERPWFRGAVDKLETRRGSDAVSEGRDLTFWTEPYVFFTAQQLGMTAARAFEAQDGRHVVAFDVLLADIDRFASTIVVSPNGTVAVMTDDLRFIALPDNRRFWSGDDPDGWQLRQPRELNNPWMDDAANAFAAQPQDQQGQSVRFRSDKEWWWGQVRSFDLASDHNLFTVVIVPNNDLLADRNAIRRWILGVTLAVLAGAIGWAMTLARRFSEPIEALAIESERMRKGDLEAPRDPVDSHLAEVHKLATAQSHMREGLRSLMKLERDIQLARQIQQSTFPVRLPVLKGFDLEAWSEPADETGGDTYDVIGYSADGDDKARINGKVDGAVMLLADATGHGIGPALSVAQIRAMLRMAVRMEGDLAKVAAHLNEQLFADLPTNRFITAWLGILDTRGHTLTDFSAGQAPLVMFEAASQQIHYFDADAPPFGLVPHLPVVAPKRRRLGRGDIFAVLSDGFFEASDPSGEEFGKERVGKVISSHPGATASEILASLRKVLDEFTCAAPADDDRTAVIIKRSG